MEPQIKPSQRAGVLGGIPPISATTVQTSAWLDATIFHNILFKVSVGVIAATGLVDAQVQQATSNAGAGAKAITGKSITTFTAAANSGNQALINLRQEDLDIANGFKWVQLSITPSVAAALISGAALGFDPRNLSADKNAAATQVQVVA